MSPTLMPDPRPLLDLGLAVFPLPVDGKAATAGWRHTHVLPGGQLRDWPLGANIGVGCRINGLVVLDLDRGESGQPLGVHSLTYSAMVFAGVPLPPTFTVLTPSGGEHRYWRIPPGRIIGSTSHGRAGLGPGIDTRGPGRTHGGYVVGPGSVIGGRAYRIQDASAPIAELPAWIADVLEDPAEHPTDHTVLQTERITL